MGVPVVVAEFSGSVDIATIEVFGEGGPEVPRSGKPKHWEAVENFVLTRPAVPVRLLQPAARDRGGGALGLGHLRLRAGALPQEERLLRPVAGREGAATPGGVGERAGGPGRHRRTARAVAAAPRLPRQARQRPRP
jgi:hypothetical protein